MSVQATIDSERETGSSLKQAATGQPQASEYKKNNQQTEHELTAECNLHVTIEEDET